MKPTAGPDLHGPATEVLAGARFVPVTSGRRSRVWRATFADDRADLAVKTPATALVADPAGTGGGTRDEAVALIHAEAKRLVWVTEHLAGRGLGLPGAVSVPEFDDPDPILVTTWLEGTVDPRLMRSPEIAVESFARALASLHEASRRIDLDDCPFDAGLDSRIAEAAARIDAGLVDTSRLDDPYDHYTPGELLDRVRQMADATNPPAPEDRVLLHGDLCVSNVVFDPAYSTTVGAVDWAFAGVGDRHQDLAITARSLARNLSGEVLPDFFSTYGLAEPDLLRIETYVALEELF
ncbi:MAG TPA: phosphotransferase [Acidimicrobiales bacterium]|nr:phosphotransferase [Acidimicrobiales bacterium]